MKNKLFDINYAIETKINEYGLVGKYADELRKASGNFLKTSHIDDSLDFSASCIQAEMFQENPELIG